MTFSCFWPTPCIFIKNILLTFYVVFNAGVNSFYILEVYVLVNFLGLSRKTFVYSFTEHVTCFLK